MKGVNAIIGVDLDFMKIGDNMIVVCANGTAVVIEKRTDYIKMALQKLQSRLFTANVFLLFILFSSQDAVKQKNICNCSEPSRFSCKSVSHACMNEHFYREIYLADTPHRRNA